MTLWSTLAKDVQRLVPGLHPAACLRLRGGHVILPSGVVQADLVIQGERITAVEYPRRGAAEERTVDVSGLLVFPGLINAHDHLEFNCFPRLGERGSYVNSYEWGLDITRRRRSAVVDRVLEIPLRERLLAGGYKNLFAGVTTVCHHGTYWRLFERGFPVAVVKRYGWCHSLGFGDDVAGSYRRTPPDAPWIIHLAEGTDERARGELAQLAALGCLAANTVVVHGVGLSQADLRLMAQQGAGLIWCPASNLFMLGQTAPIRDIVGSLPPSQESPPACTARVALGSDSRLTGSRDLLAELNVARSLGVVSDEQLFRMVTQDAARLLRIDGQVGTIETAKRADLLVLAGDPASPYQALATAYAERADIRLVLVGGRPAFGAPEFSELFQAWRGPYTPAYVRGQPRLVAGRSAQVRRYLEIETRLVDLETGFFALRESPVSGATL
jgi:cytosine/adenosine deaminase-related metal-dependent hydrolase